MSRPIDTIEARLIVICIDFDFDQRPATILQIESLSNHLIY